MKTKLWNISLLLAMALCVASMFSPAAYAAAPDAALPSAGSIVAAEAYYVVNPVDAIGQALYVAPYAPAPIQPSGTMTVSIDPEVLADFTSAITDNIPSMFIYATLLLIILMPIVVIGIGFRFGGRIATYIGDVIGDALK